MKLTFKINDRITIEAEGDKQTDVFEQIASAQEVFDNLKCKANGSTDVQFVVRTDKDENKYYEMRDRKEGYRLSFHQYKKGGGLYLPKKDKDGNWLPSDGWYKYVPPAKEEGK